MVDSLVDHRDIGVKHFEIPGALSLFGSRSLGLWVSLVSESLWPFSERARQKFHRVPKCLGRNKKFFVEANVRRITRQSPPSTFLISDLNRQIRLPLRRCFRI